MLSRPKRFNKTSVFFATWLVLVVLLNACINAPVDVPSLVLDTDQLPEADADSEIIAAFSTSQSPNPTRSAYLPAAIAIHPYDRSVLTITQKVRLYTASQKFLAPTTSQSVQVAQSLEFVGGDYGHPSNMCGPLAIGILRDAGLVSPYVDLSEFWILDPRPGMNDDVVERTFPRDKYFWYQTSTRIDQFDFNIFPLYTGDFVYIYAGYYGTFEHILTVTRVDETGRAYTTTNIRRENYEYFIEELLLYDPNNPGEGLFNYWTDLSNTALGITGFGGFSLWRPITPIPEITNQQQDLALAIDEIVADAGGNWNTLIKEVGGDTIYARQTNVRIHTASLTKVPLAMLFFHVLEQNGIEITMGFLESSGANGRSFAQLLEAMLVNSEDAAAQTLENWVSEWVYPPDVFTAWGFPSTQLILRGSTMQEIVRLFESLYIGELIGPLAREIILYYLSADTASGDRGLGTLRAYLPTSGDLYHNRGPLLDDRPLVADVAIVKIGGTVYILAFFAEASERLPTTYKDLDGAVTKAGQAFWDVYGE